ncbi:MAG: hypothetical protein CL840_16525 [Crocinitomicaceae bacterium]|nr:hypothetical protein [Crocinitomicaceae bacterium]|tara:strand:+ start:3007 stop:14076 length:11070 start_codon:yes stop_codon:yes gene_type:complete
MKTINVQIANTADNLETYDFSGYCEIWFVAYPDNTDGPESPGDYDYSKYIDNIYIDKDGAGSLQVADDVFIDVDKENPTVTYNYIEARYYINEEEIDITGSGNYVAPNTFYFLASSNDMDIGFDIDILLNNSEPDPYIYDISFQRDDNNEVVSNIVCNGKILDSGDVELEDLGELTTNSRGAVVYNWEAITGQAKLEISIPAISQTFSAITISGQEVSTTLLVDAVELDKEVDNVIPDIDLLGAGGLFEMLSITVNDQLNNFLTNENSLESLRALRKIGGTDNMVGYDELSTENPDNKGNVLRVLAQARLNLVFFPEGGNETEVVDFNDHLYTDQQIESPKDLLETFSPSTFVKYVHGEGLSSPPSDFQLAAMYALSERQVQLSSNLLTDAATDKVYPKGNGIAETVFGSSDPLECECKDCTSAVSPLSYLGSLISYAEENVLKDVASEYVETDITDYTSYLCQPLSTLPVSCDNSEKKICSFRVQMEVLYCYDNNATRSDCDTRNFRLQKKQYLELTYKFLLEYIGTSYYEIFSAQGNSDQQQEISKRIGIVPVYDSVNTVETLYFDFEVFEDIDPTTSGYLTGLTNLENKLQDIFGLAKDSQNPLVAPDKAEYLTWREDQTKDNWTEQDTPTGYFLDDSSYYVDPDLVNPDDVRYSINAASLTAPYKTLTQTDIYKLWENRKKWREVASVHVKDDWNTKAGFIQGVNKIQTSIAYSSTLSLIKGTILSIQDSATNAGNFEISGGLSWTSTAKLGLELSTPLPDTVVDRSANMIFELGSTVKAYTSQVIEIDDAVANLLNTGFVRLIAADKSKSILLKGTVSTSSKIAITLLPGQTWASITGAFPANTDPILSFQVKTPVYSTGASYDMKDSLIRTGDEITCFGNRSSELTLGKEFWIEGSENNDGTYEVDSSSLYQLDDTSFNPTAYDLTNIVVEKEPATEGNKSSVTANKGGGNLHYYKANTAVSSADNGSELFIDAGGLKFSDEATLLEEGDGLLLDLGSGEFSECKVATHADANNSTNKVWAQEVVSEADANILKYDPKTGTPEKIQIIIDPDVVAASNATFVVAGRDLTDYISVSFSLTLRVYKQNDYDTSVATPSSITFASNNSTITVPGNPLLTSEKYVLAVEVDVLDFTQNQSRLVLTSPPTGFMTELFAGDEVRLLDGTPDLLQEMIVAGLSTNEIFVEGIIEAPASVANTSYEMVFPILMESPLLDNKVGSSDNSMAGGLSVISTASNFQYTPVYYNATVNINFTSWDLSSMTGTDLYAELLVDANTLIGGGSSTTWVSKLHMQNDSFLKFVELYGKLRTYLSDPANSETLTEEELVDFRLIVESSIKEALIQTPNPNATSYLAWEKEELELLIDLQATSEFSDIKRLPDPRLFQISTYAPKILTVDNIIENQSESPLIDGEYPLLLKPLQSHAGEDSTGVMLSRIDEFNYDLTFFEGLFLDLEYDEFIKSIWKQFIPNTVSAFFEDITNRLYGIKASDRIAAEEFITQELFLSREDFEALTALRNKWVEKKSVALFTEEEKSFIVKQLTSSYKQQSIFPLWTLDEQSQFDVSTVTLLDGLVMRWKVAQVGIKPWVTTPELRMKWVNAIGSRQSNLAIDPDNINLRYINNISDSSASSTYRVYDLFKTRKVAVENWQSVTVPGTPNELEKVKYYCAYLLQISVEELDGLVTASNDGENVSDRLRQLLLSNHAFYRMVEIVELATATPTTAIPDEVEKELFSLLVQVKKERTYCEWKDIEVYDTGSNAPITIGPEFFKEPNLALTFDDNNYANSNFKWRFNQKTHQKWQRRFKGRKLSWEAIEENQEVMLMEADNHHMMLLRDAYIDYIGTNDTLEENAQEMSDRLLLDFEQQCCAKTTRVSTAITAMQNFFYVLNNETGNPANATYDLQAPYFDKEWKWLGTYGSFRSAMFVYLFPENLLHPSLRREQSSKFKEINNRMNQGGRFTPETACGLASEYADYLKDITNLYPACSANSLVLQQKGKCDDKQQAGMQKTAFSFALGGNSKLVYCSQIEYSKKDSTNINWVGLNAFKSGKVVRVVGASNFKNTKNERHLYLFAIVREEVESELAFIRYNLDTNYWDEEYTILEMPGDQKWYWNSLQVLQRHGEKRNPMILFSMEGENGSVGGVYGNQLNDDGDDWKFEDPVALTTASAGKDLWLEGAIEIGEVSSASYQTSMALIYGNINAGNIVIQPFIYAPESTHFGHFMSMRPGKFYGLRYNSTEGYELAPMVLDVDSNANIYTDWCPSTYKGSYSDNSSSFEFTVMFRPSSSTVNQQIKVSLANETEAVNNINFTALQDLFFLYFNMDLNHPMMHSIVSKRDISIASFFGLAEQGYIKRARIVEIKQLVFSISSFLKPKYIKKRVVEIDPSEHKNHAEYEKAMNFDFFNGLRKYWLPTENETPQFSTWYFIAGYFKSFFSLGNQTTGLVSSPSSGISGRPGLHQVFAFPCWPSGIIIKQVAWLISGEKKLSVSSYDTSYVKQVYPNAFLEATADQFSIVDRINGPNIEFYENNELGKYSELKQWGLRSYYNGNIPITSNKNSADFQHQRVQVQSMMDSNKNSPSLSNYMAEAYYFLPMLLALKLHENGYFEEALAWYRSVYDYQWKTPAERKIYYGLVLEEFTKKNYSLAADWLLDPMDPHNIAMTRTEAYTSYTITSIVKCLLDWADQQFTIDTVETISLATKYYEEAEVLMSNSLFTPNTDPCACGDGETDLWREVRCMDNLEYLIHYRKEITELGYLLNQVTSCTARDTLISDAKTDYLKDKTTTQEIIEGLAEFQEEIDTVIDGQTPPAIPTYAGLLSSAKEDTATYFDHLYAVDNYDYLAETTSKKVYDDCVAVFEQVTGYEKDSLVDNSTALDFLEYPYDDPSDPAYTWTQGEEFLPDLRKEGAEKADGFALTNLAYINYPLSSTRTGYDYQANFAPRTVSFQFCVPLNPVYEAHTLRAQANLFKIRNCMNIAGMKRELDPYAAPTDSKTGLPSIGSGGRLVVAGQLAQRPTQYRYRVLIARAKELTQVAQQLESVYLASLEKKDAETYTLLKAKQDLKLSKEGVKLSDYKLRVSESEVDLAEIQRSRYELQVSELDAMINSALTQSEQALINAYVTLAGANTDLIRTQLNQTRALASAGIATGTSNAVIAATSQDYAGAAQYSANATAAAVSLGFANVISNHQLRIVGIQQEVSRYSLMASVENRKRDWRFQMVLAQKDIEIASQQITVAQNRVKVSSQEKKMAELTQQFAEDTLDFLKNKFTNAELYSWMSKVLANAYSNVLAQATATAKMAEQQISFERQNVPPVALSDDYWEAPSMSVSLENLGGPDRRGLTGSYRLMQDLIQLDQWAFASDERKLEVTKSFSLAQKYPMEFEIFKQTGELVFDTTLEQFDRDFPGQYMRIIRKVTVNVVALTPPVEGVKATLTHAGNSKVVVKGDIYQEATLRRQPEMIAFSNPQNATGMLELQPLNPEMFNPFEGNGVVGMWQLEMDKESNMLDYSTIADVIIKIDYTALHNFDYETEVRRNMDPAYHGERLYSFRNEFADQFYELANASESSTPFKVNINTSAYDFPMNLNDISISGLRVMFTGRAEVLRSQTVKPFKMQYVDQLGTDSNEVDVSLNKELFAGTIGGGGAGMLKIVEGGPTVNGTWTFDFNPLKAQLKGNRLQEMFNNGDIDDILFVVDFTGSINK